MRNADGNFALTYIDELVDQMLNNEYLFDVALPRIPNRHALFPPMPLLFPYLVSTAEQHWLLYDL